MRPIFEQNAARIAQLEADNLALRVALEKHENLVPGEESRAFQFAKLEAQLALAEAVCEALDGSCASDIVGNDGVKALAAWRAGKQKSEKHERDAE